MRQHPKFRIKTRSAEYRFHLTGSQGEVVLISQAYETIEGAEDGILLARASAALPERFERRRSHRDEPYFVLRDSNGKVIGISELYASEGAMENGMERVRRSARAARVERRERR